MEIIHLVLGKANPDRMNGVNKVVFQLASRQAESGRKVSVWGITRNPVHNYGTRSFETRLFRAFRNPFKMDNALKQALLETSSNSVVHLHGGWIPVFSTIAVFLAKNQIPYVMTPHGAFNRVAMQRSRFQKQVYFRLFEKSVLDHAQKIHALGESEISGLASVYPIKKTFLLPYGFDYLPAQNSETAKPKNRLVIGFIGRPDIYTKGLDLLTAAFVEISKKYPQAVVWIVGDGPQRTELEAMTTNAGIADKVVFHGAKFGREKDELLHQMDIFVHPSRNEGLPASVLEACAAGTPVVVSLATNMAAWVEKYRAGIAIPDEDSTALATAIETMMQQPAQLLPEMGKNARQMIREVFDWNHILNRFDELYRR